MSTRKMLRATRTGPLELFSGEASGCSGAWAAAVSLVLACAGVFAMADAAQASEALQRQARDAADPKARAHAVFELRASAAPSGISEDVRALLVEQVAEEHDPEVLRQLISGLEACPPEHAVAPLFHLLDPATESDVRQRVVEALFRFRDAPGVVDKLQAVLSDDPSPAVRRHVPLWLGLMQRPAVFQALRQAYDREKDPEVKAALIQAIALQRTEQADRLLTRIAIQDRNLTLRQLARKHAGFRRAKPDGQGRVAPLKSGEQVMECDVSRAAFQPKRP